MNEICLYTTRLTLRPYEAADFPAWVNANQGTGPAVNHFDIPGRKSEELTPNMFEQILAAQKALRAQGEFFHLGVFRGSDGALLGIVSLMDIKRQVVFNANIGYFFYNQYWGQGYAKEAVEGAIEIAFKQLSLHRVEAAIEPDNFRSIRLAEKAGLRLEGFKRNFLFLRNTWRDMLIYAMTSNEKGLEHPGPEKSKLPNLRW